jgi:ABC-2 type transport system permease protein
VFEISFAKIALASAYFIVGYLTFACLMIGTGMLGRTAQEGAQISAIWMLIASAPWFFVANISANPTGLASRLFSFFPLTSAITMIMRIMNGEVAPIEIALTLGVDLVAILLIFKAASRIFRASALMYGKRATLPELWRSLRAA